MAKAPPPTPPPSVNSTSLMSAASGMNPRDTLGSLSVALKMPSTMRPPSATNSLASYDSNGSTIPSAPPRTLENHTKTSAGDMKIVGRDKCLPAVFVPLAGSGDVKMGVLGVDSFAVGQSLAEDSSRMLKFKQVS